MIYFSFFLQQSQISFFIGFVNKAPTYPARYPASSDEGFMP